MENYQARVFPPMVSTKMYTSYKVDEGYSEDTRSQDDPDSPMRSEPGGDDMLQKEMISDAILALGEGEKSGRPLSTTLKFQRDHTEILRTRIQHPTYSQSFIHSLRR